MNDMNDFNVQDANKYDYKTREYGAKQHPPSHKSLIVNSDNPRIIRIDNYVTQYGRHHINIFVVNKPEAQLMVLFKGVNVPGVLRVLDTSFVKNTKTGYRVWEVEMMDDVDVWCWHEDYNGAGYITAGSWDRYIKQVRRMSKMEWLRDETIDIFTRSELPEEAFKLDALEHQYKGPTSPLVIEQLLVAQMQLAEANRAYNEVKQQEEVLLREMGEADKIKDEAVKVRELTIETQERVEKARRLMEDGASLSDLKELLS